MTVTLPLFAAALLVSAAVQHSDTVRVVYPKTVWGATRLLEVERLAARYEQASGEAESSIEVVHSIADVATLCARPGSQKILYVEPITFTIITRNSDLQPTVHATLVSCTDSVVTQSSRSTVISAAVFEDPSVLRAYKTLETLVIGDLLSH